MQQQQQQQRIRLPYANVPPFTVKCHGMLPYKHVCVS
jgi:hypothetical protein